jgi:hypothetical protein
LRLIQCNGVFDGTLGLGHAADQDLLLNDPHPGMDFPV